MTSAARDLYPTGAVLAGRYQIRRELGRGGMGVVLLCRDLQNDERVAVKVLSRPPARSKSEESWWFYEEARALAGLSHPAIVRARDFGALPDGTPYLVMDAAPGRSLHEWLYLAKADGTLPFPVIWSAVDQVLGALAHAHSRSVIHGDLKPSNVLLDLTPSPPTVHVLDLGLAWLVQDRIDHRLDGTSAVPNTIRWGAGTPGWMAPEQIRFAAPHIGPATDLYALGCILYAMLANKEVYAGTPEELLAQHRNAPIPDPDLPPDAPPGVAQFVKRLLAKRPWHRYMYAGDARRDFEAFMPEGIAVQSERTRLAMSRGPASRRGGPISTTSAVTIQGGADEPECEAAAGLLGLRPSPFVARYRERAELERIADSVTIGAQNEKRFVLLMGDAGVGKSRLAEWLCEEMHERATMIPLRARYHRMAAPLDGVVGAVTQHYRLERAERDVVEKVLMNLWGVSPDDEEGLTWVAAAAEWIRPVPLAPEATGPTGKRFALDRPALRWLVIRRVLEHIGRDRPVVLWMDDLHYASQTTFEGLARLYHDAQKLRLLVVATARSEAVESDPIAAARLDHALREMTGVRIVVPPLEPTESFSLLRETLPLDDAAVAEAASRSKGNPLFMLQLVHAWAGGGHLELREGRYHVPRAAFLVRAKTTAELWEERLLALPDELRVAARAATALGGDIRLDVLRSLWQRLGINADEGLSRVVRAQLLVAAGDNRLRWPHALLQEHLLTQLLVQPDSARVFRAAADALALHPGATGRRIVRHRVTNLIRAGEPEAAAAILHPFIASLWSRTRDATMALRDLALLDGKLSGATLAVQKRWRAEALRHAGRLDEARREAEDARESFHASDDRLSEASCLRLLGHIASDLSAPAAGRRLVARALALYEECGNDDGRASCELVLGEIDYLLGEHARARETLTAAERSFLRTGGRLGRAQALLLLGFVAQAGSSSVEARDLHGRARAEFDAIGYRLGIAQSDIALAHVEHREGKLESATTVATRARQSFRDLGNPRGEAACERLLAMTALDRGDVTSAEAHALSAGALFDRISDPWGQVETRLLFAQIALEQGQATAAREHLIACEAVALAEAEPQQHRHMTLAWLAYHEGRFYDAARELDAARASFKDAGRTGDHTPQLLERFAKMAWPKPAGPRVTSWRRALASAQKAKPVEMVASPPA